MITLTRGDTRAYYFTRLDNDDLPITDIPDSLLFTIKKSWHDSDFVVQKGIDDMTAPTDDDNSWHFKLLPEDTQSLPVRDYVFDIEVIQNGVVTTICKDELRLTKESTWSINR